MMNVDQPEYDGPEEPRQYAPVVVVEAEAEQANEE